MSDSIIANHSVLVAVLHDEARVWNVDDQENAAPFVITRPEHENRHVREAQHNGGHESSNADPEFFKAISDAISQAREIVLIGHGTGKANSMHVFHEHVKSHNAHVADKILAELIADLPAMTHGQIKKLGHDWFVAHRKGSASH